MQAVHHLEKHFGITSEQLAKLRASIGLFSLAAEPVGDCSACDGRGHGGAENVELPAGMDVAVRKDAVSSVRARG